MPRRPAPRRATRPAPAVKPREPGRRWRWGIVGVVLALGVVAAWWGLIPESPAALRARGESAEAAGDWPRALDAWRSLNATKAARARTWLAEARACLALDLAARAESALKAASEADPADPEPWRLRLNLLRAEGRTLDALRDGWSAHGAVAPGSRPAILRGLTLALLLLDDALDDRPDAALDRWVAADPSDVNALLAQHQRAAALPRPGDPGLSAWVETLAAILDRDPNQVGAREAMVVALADAGEIDRGRATLDAWPDAQRDARYQRLRGRWDLDFDAHPDRAAAAFEAALIDLPHDWKTRARLARAHAALGRAADARREADRVARLRELLDPSTLVPRLARDFAHLDDPASRLDLADLSARAGLERLANAWHREAQAPAVTR